MKIHEISSGVVVITPAANLLGSEIDELETGIRQTLDAGKVRLAIDLSETYMSNSTALGVLLAAYTGAIRNGGNFVFVGMSPMRHLFGFLPKGIRDYFQSMNFDTVEEAARFLEDHPHADWLK